MSDWLAYQNEVAEFFRRAGWTVEVEAQVQGVRTRHKIDVWALSRRLGVVIRWVIECKDWNSRVPKEKVLALRTIVDDVGADRGLILNEKGFQAGAIEAAHSANVTVTTLASLREHGEEELWALELAGLHRRAIDLTIRTSRLWVTAKMDGDSMSRNRRGVVDQQGVIGNFGAVSTIEDAVARALAGHLPVTMPDSVNQEFVRVHTRKLVIQRATEALDQLEVWLAEQERGVTDAGGWDDPWNAPSDD